MGWVKAFTTHTSSTYLNQWLVVDYNLFTPGQPLKPNTLWMAEENPKAFFTRDLTPVLAAGTYWPSYNVPANSVNYVESGFPAAVAEWGPYLFSRNNASRAHIFARNESRIATLDDFGALLRYNDWKNDPASIGPDGVPNAGLSISSRFDLVTR